MSTLGCSSGQKKPDGGPGDGGLIDLAIGDLGGDTGGGDTGGDSGAGHEPLCDGVAHLRLWVLIQPGDELRGSLVRVENGVPFLAVDGTCSYWLGGGWVDDALSRDRPIRTGKITATDVASLEQMLPLQNIAALGDCPPPPPGLFDYSLRLIRTATGFASCITSAPELTAGTRFEGAWTTLETIATRLWTAGTPVAGALHVSAVDASGGVSAQPAYTWPIASPLASFVLADSDWQKAGVSHLVDDPTAASQLRALRDQYLADRTAQPGLFVNWDGLQATDSTTTAFVYMRDATPYEDAQGLLGF